MGDIELSVVIPCLNEADTIEACVHKAMSVMKDQGIKGEVIVADNGSSDESPQIAERLGAKIVHVSEKGYGNALMGGIEASQGKFIIMADADDSYDFFEIPKFIEKLREGFDLVMGCRLPKGGGAILPGAMPFLHRWWGNPMFSYMARKMFKAPITDVYCGMRGFTRSHYDSLNVRCTGMEFATEMVIKSGLFKAKITEVPITLHPDGRKTRAPHLKTFSDGWRTLRFFLAYSPRWLYLVPAFFLVALGLLGYALSIPGYAILGARLDVHTLLFSSLFIMMGFQAGWFALMAKVFVIGAGLYPNDPKLTKFFGIFTLEKALIISAIMLVVGVFLLSKAVYQWYLVDFGNLDYPRTLRLVIPGITLAALGFQTFLSSFFVSLMGLRHK